MRDVVASFAAFLLGTALLAFATGVIFAGGDAIVHFTVPGMMILCGVAGFVLAMILGISSGRWTRRRGAR